MANYYATSRSNYFQVKDREAFEKAMEPFDVSVHFELRAAPGDTHPKSPLPDDAPVAPYVCLLWNEGDQAGISHQVWDDDAADGEGDFVEVDFFQLISSHLVEGSVAVFKEAGAEKFRYVVGYAVAVNHLGETVVINTDDIYAQAAEKFGVNKDQISLAHY